MGKNKRKILFTLIEMLIVIIIIGIILSSLVYMSWKYILRLRFNTDLQLFRTNYQFMLAKTLGIFNYGKSYTGGIDIASSGNVLKFWYLSGGSKVFFKNVILNNSKINSIKINNNSVNSGSLIFRSYKLGIYFKDNLGNLYKTGNLKIGFKYSGITGDEKIYLDIGKLY